MFDAWRGGYIKAPCMKVRIMMSEHDVIVTRTIHADASRVWATLTRPELVKRWMRGAEVDSTWEPGAMIIWSFEYEGKRYQDMGEIVEISSPKRLVHTHFSGMSGAEDKPENYHEVGWQLDDEGGSTKLTLTQDGVGSTKEAEEFKASWRTMLDSLRDVAEAG